MPIIATTTQVPASPAAPSVVQTPVQLPRPQNNLLAAQGILNQLYLARVSNPSGVTSITIDGQQTVYASAAALDQAIYFWEKKVALLGGKRRRAMTIRLDRF